MVEDIVIISNRTDAVCQENDFLGPKQANTKCIILYVNFPGKRNSIEKNYNFFDAAAYDISGMDCMRLDIIEL